jgi:hypothetical protein
MADLKNIALTRDAQDAVGEIRKWTGIADQLDLIRLGFAYAVKHVVPLDPVGTRAGSNYDTGGIDVDGLMAETVKLYYPQPDVQDEPYRAIEILMSRGLLLVAEHYSIGRVGCLADLLSPASSE